MPAQNPCETFPADAMFELHIEQGPILEAEDKQIGIVTGAQAQIWWEAEVLGQDSHAGTTPPVARRDALLTTARIIELVDATMREEGDTNITDLGRGTVGRLNVFPNSPNVVPGADQIHHRVPQPLGCPHRRYRGELSRQRRRRSRRPITRR